MIVPLEGVCFKIINHKLLERKAGNYSPVLNLTQKEKEELRQHLPILDITLDNAFGVRLKYDNCTD